MRFVHFGLITALMVLVAACHGSDKPGDDSGGRAAEKKYGGHKPKVALGPYDYTFSGANDNGTPCTTGLKEFETLHLMCINIQDPIQNNNCAMSKRIDKFIQDCSPRGYEFNESHQCRVSLIEQAAEISTFGEYDKKYLVTSADFCAGRTRRGVDQSGIYLKAFLHDRIVARVAMNFVPKRDTYADHRSHFNLMLTKQEHHGRPIELMDEFVYHSGVKVMSGTLHDGAYKYLIQCGNIWACTDSSQ